LRAVSVTAGLADGTALGDAFVDIQRMAAPLLPPGSRIIPLAEAASLDENANGILITFAFALLVIFLVLSAQFESFVGAIIVMATVPLGLACAVFALLLTGSSLNVYSQIGLVLLVGIMAKNGILIVEFANQLRDRGHNVREAIEEACTIRLRPVMMTMISTILGGLPLVLATGAGAEAREALGAVIVGGLGLAVFATLYDSCTVQRAESQRGSEALARTRRCGSAECALNDGQACLSKQDRREGDAQSDRQRKH
jgi:hydrophobic/amphiphilic exporter-1 (mainly G- bacteria), HAE1 family